VPPPFPNASHVPCGPLEVVGRRSLWSSIFSLLSPALSSRVCLQSSFPFSLPAPPVGQLLALRFHARETTPCRPYITLELTVNPAITHASFSPAPEVRPVLSTSGYYAVPPTSQSTLTCAFPLTLRPPCFKLRSHGSPQQLPASGALVHGLGPSFRPHSVGAPPAWLHCRRYKEFPLSRRPVPRLLSPQGFRAVNREGVRGLPANWIASESNHFLPDLHQVPSAQSQIRTKAGETNFLIRCYPTNCSHDLFGHSAADTDASNVCCRDPARWTGPGLIFGGPSWPFARGF